MKFLIVGLLAIVSVNSFAETYIVYLKRIDKNLYKDTQSGVYIKTQYCYAYTYGDKAYLEYDSYSYDNKIIFTNDQTCEVKKVFK